jgi:hypothetical protein
MRRITKITYEWLAMKWQRLRQSRRQSRRATRRERAAREERAESEERVAREERAARELEERTALTRAKQSIYHDAIERLKKVPPLPKCQGINRGRLEHMAQLALI